MPPAAWPCCMATWRPTDAWSSRPPCDRRCCATRGRRGYSIPRRRPRQPFWPAASRPAMWWWCVTKDPGADRACVKCSPHLGHCRHATGRPGGAAYRRPLFRRHAWCGHRSYFAGSGPGGPLALVQEGDVITIDIPAKRISLLKVDEGQMTARRKAWQPPAPKATHGYLARYAAAVGSAAGGAVVE
jgi:hypothetical protein